MFRLTRAQVQPIGVDLGHDSVKMLQLEVVGDGLSVLAAARQAMPDEARQAPPDVRIAVAAGVVRQMLKAGGFAGREVVLALPREVVHVKNLRMPPIPPAELAGAVAFEARNVFPFDVDQAHVRHLPAGEVRQGAETRHEVILFASKNGDVDEFVERFHGAGAVVRSVDVEPCAAYRCVERFIRRREDEVDVHVVVDVGARRTLVVIGRGREISFVKPIDLGGNHLHEAVATKLGLSVDEARTLRRRLAETPDAPGVRDPVRQAVYEAARGPIEELGREIALCLRYYSVTFRGSRPSRVRLVGGESCDPNVLAMLNAALPLPVEAGRPLYSVNTSKMKPSDRRGTLGEWAVALGLALKLTTARFGPRDGKPRDPNDPRPDVTGPVAADAARPVEQIPGSLASVVNLDQAVRAAGNGTGAGANADATASATNSANPSNPAAYAVQQGVPRA